jgi:hypothetical protein
MGTMHSDYYETLQALAKCRYQVGSYDKRFVHDLASLGPYDMLTLKQQNNIERLAFRYRRQLGGLKYRVPITFIEAAVDRAKAAKAGQRTPEEVRYHWVPEQRPQPTDEANPQLTLELP